MEGTKRWRDEQEVVLTANLMVEKLPLIKVVGVSASGKSTLVEALRAVGWNARPVSQEHSDAPDLWKQFGFPRVLIYLDNDLEGQRSRRPDVSWSAENLAKERQRLRHAYEHADLRINTAHLTAEQVRELVIAFLEANRIRRASTPLPPLPRTGGSSKT
jgi:energy-coupling factor transporter ATP-binding protein EcfA2